ncbi:MAG: hypothetical protein WB992_00920 [Bryobacteraceae bacterium]
MSVSNVSGHWTDEQLIEYLYGVGPENGHVDGCADCQARLASMRARGRSAECSDCDVSFELLAAQRRKIYARLTARAHWWTRLQPRRLASAAATLAVLGGGLFIYEGHHKQQITDNKLSDVQLAQQVSNMAEEAEAQPTAPLQALFEE